MSSLGVEVKWTHYPELGPIDAQYRDANREENLSALDEVQAFERINGEALQTMNQTITWLRIKTRKKDDTLLPLVLHYVAETLRPAFEGIDSVRFSQVSRMLKIGEEYALRLLQRTYGDSSYLIANQLVRAYPTHGFIIDRDEVENAIGLKIKPRSADLEGTCRSLASFLKTHDAIGRIIEG